ncbi:hypothetical protein Cadr_000019719, partial [Camelus dromedarius]
MSHFTNWKVSQVSKSSLPCDNVSRLGFGHIQANESCEDVSQAHLPQQGPFRHFMDMKAEKRLAGRKERRSRFGDINVHKCYQFGQVFRPFQALAST